MIQVQAAARGAWGVSSGGSGCVGCGCCARVCAGVPDGRLRGLVRMCVCCALHSVHCAPQQAICIYICTFFADLSNGRVPEQHETHITASSASISLSRLLGGCNSLVGCGFSSLMTLNALLLHSLRPCLSCFEHRHHAYRSLGSRGGVRLKLQYSNSYMEPFQEKHSNTAVTETAA